jgi:hypothetical protein
MGPWDHRYLIIAGTSKGGTTSIFEYLANHPQICASVAKETRFFLETSYPLPSKRRYEKDGPEAYLNFYRHCRGREGDLRLEATPDYLYGRETACWIRRQCPNARLVFVLREPRSRLLSFYRFGQQLGEIPSKMAFDKFIELQAGDKCEDHPSGRNHPAFYGLAQGRYSYYLRPYFSLFDRTAIYIAFYEQLCADPLAFMSALCHWAGIDESYFQQFSFKVRNRSVKMRNPQIHRLYFKTREGARQLISDHPWLRTILRGVDRQIDQAYRKMNVTTAERIAVSSDTERIIASYYAEEPAELERLTGLRPPWGSVAEAPAGFLLMK